VALWASTSPVNPRSASEWARTTSFVLHGPNASFSSSSSSKEDGKGRQTRANQEQVDEEEEVKAEDLYEVLGLRRGADPDEIKAAYRQMVKECHPDLRPGDAEAAKHFREVSNAYTTLLHVGLRRMYDLHLRHQEQRERLKERQEQERLSGLRGIIFVRHRRASAAAMVVFTALLSWALLEHALWNPSLFWKVFRNVPDWMPGKWRLSELFMVAAERRRGKHVEE